MPTITQLPSTVINKIAAGEVIERPASIIKELMENSIDAGASRVDVSVEQGGIQRVCVVDDGCGIAPDELLLAVTSHATSKIQDADDLFRVSTLGFRGEALASIASVSRLRIRSRRHDSDVAYELRVDGGNVQQPTPCSGAPGTSLDIQNLFFNTPVRRKFLRSRQTEMGHGNEAFIRMALAYPGIHFTLRHDDRLIHDLAPVDDLPARILALFGEDVAQSLIGVEGDDKDHVRLHGFVGDPSQSRSNNRMQYLFLNGRYIRDRSLQHALGEAYRGLLMVGRYPIAFLQIEMPAESVDVNVHPTKLEVRFQDGRRVYSKLLGSLRSRFLTSDLTHSLDKSSPRITTNTHTTPDTSDNRQGRVGPWMRDVRLDTSRSLSLEHTPTSNPVNAPLKEKLQFRPAPTHALNDRVDTVHNYSDSIPQTVSPPTVTPDHLQPSPRPEQGSANLAIQIHNCYLITETDNGMIVIDQHALHERILYEQTREKVLSGKIESQKLLVPEPVKLAPTEAIAVLEARELLSEMGIDVQPFGGDTVLVSGYPAMLANINPEELLRQVVDHLLSEGKNPDRRDILDSLMHMISCKAAIKAGDRLTPEEIMALIQQRELVQDSHHCPHGRPTSLVLTKQELDRKFGRT